MVFAAGDCLYEKKIILRHLGLLLAALFISVGRGPAAEFEAGATKQKFIRSYKETHKQNERRDKCTRKNPLISLSEDIICWQ